MKLPRPAALLVPRACPQPLWAHHPVPFAPSVLWVPTLLPALARAHPVPRVPIRLVWVHPCAPPASRVLTPRSLQLNAQRAPRGHTPAWLLRRPARHALLGHSPTLWGLPPSPRVPLALLARIQPLLPLHAATLARQGGSTAAPALHAHCVLREATLTVQ